MQGETATHAQERPTPILAEQKRQPFMIGTSRLQTYAQFTAATIVIIKIHRPVQPLPDLTCPSAGSLPCSLCPGIA